MNEAYQRFQASMTEIQTTSDTLPRRAATGYRPSPAMRLVLSYVRRSKVGRLRLVLPDGRQLVFGRDAISMAGTRPARRRS